MAARPGGGGGRSSRACFHERHVTVHMFSTSLTPVGCHEFSCALSEKVRKRLKEPPTTTVSPDGLKAAAVNSSSPCPAAAGRERAEKAGGSQRDDAAGPVRRGRAGGAGLVARVVEALERHALLECPASVQR